MELLQSIIVVAGTFAVLVVFHEFGHFWVARRLGVKVVRFAVGFGHVLWRRYGRDGTEYVLCALPLGGYVRMVDEREGEVAPADLPYAFNRQPVIRRFAIVVAGPAANFLLALVAYWVVFLGGVTGMVPVIGQVVPGSVADTAGLEAGQRIVSVDGDATGTWREVNRRLLPWLGETGDVEISVRYPDSDFVYQSKLPVKHWLSGQDDPDLLGGLGIEPWRPKVVPVVDRVVAGSPAARAGLQSGDRIVSADGKAMPDWHSWVAYVQARPGQQIRLIVERDGARRTLQITPERVERNGKALGHVGVSVKPPEIPPSMLHHTRYGPLGAVAEAGREVVSLTGFTLQSVWKLMTGLISPKNLSGPITIAKVASASARSGLESWLSVVALLSVSLGVLNLLPIPVLDGGHLMYYVIEWIKGSPVSEKAQTVGYQLGLSIIVGIMLLAVYNDISRL